MLYNALNAVLAAQDNDIIHSIAVFKNSGGIHEQILNGQVFAAYRFLKHRKELNVVFSL